MTIIKNNTSHSAQSSETQHIASNTRTPITYSLPRNTLMDSSTLSLVAPNSQLAVGNHHCSISITPVKTVISKDIIDMSMHHNNVTTRLTPANTIHKQHALACTQVDHMDLVRPDAQAPYPQ